MFGFLLMKEAKTLKADVSLIEAQGNIAEKLVAEAGESILEIKRVKGVGNTSVVYFKTYIKTSMNLSINADDYYGSLYEMLLEKGIKVDEVYEYLEAVNPDEEVQKMLNVEENQPILKRVRNTFNRKKNYAEYTECYYIGERYRYYLDFYQVNSK